MKNIYFSILLFFLLLDVSYGQLPPLYSLYMYNGFVINPALAGNKDVLNVVLHYKNQWSGFDQHPVTYTGSLDTPLKNNNIGAGGIFTIDKHGLLHNTDYIQSFSFKTSVKQKYQLAFGVGAGFSYRRYNFAGLDLPADDWAFSTPSSFTLLTGAGAYFNSDKFFAGISVPNYNIGRKTNLIVVNPTIYLTSGYTFTISPILKATPSVLIKFPKYFDRQTDVNLLFHFKDLFTAGCSYRHKNALVFMTEFSLNQLRLGYGYDYSLGGFNRYSRGSHEIVLKYQFRYIIKVMDPRTFK